MFWVSRFVGNLCSWATGVSMATEKRYNEKVGDISLTLIKHRGLPGTRRWGGNAWAYWGGFYGSKPTHRSLRAVRKSLVRKLLWHRGNLGQDTERTIQDAKGGIRDFRGRELSDIDLHGMDLRRSNFTNTGLQNSNFREAELRGSNFTCANISSADFTEANLADSILTATRLFNTDLKGAVFERASHRGRVAAPPPNPRIPMEGWVGWLYFVDCDLSDCNFDNAKLPGAFFKRCDLSRATFRGANLEGARILDCEVDGTIFEDAILTGAHIGQERPEDPDDKWF